MASGSTRVVIVAFVLNMLITLSKFIAWAFTGSASMLAEGFHSVADSGNQVFLFLGLKKSQKPPDAQHPFGYGNEEYFFSFLVALLIFSVGAIFALYEGIHKTLHPEPIENGIWNVGVLGFAVVLETYSALVATKELNKVRGKVPFLKYASQSKDQVLITVVFEDYAALFGLGIAFIGNLGALITGNPVYDSIGSIFIGILLGFIAFFLYKETKSLLIGEGATEEDQAKIRQVFENSADVVELKEILTLHFGANQLLINAHVKLRSGMTIEDVEVAIDKIEERIVEEVPSVYKIFIETHQKEKLETIERKKH